MLAPNVNSQITYVLIKIATLHLKLALTIPTMSVLLTDLIAFYQHLDKVV